MGKWRRILLASLLVVIVGGTLLVVTLRHDSEPSYQGKPLSAWLETYVPSTNFGQQQMAEARTVLSAMGTNAIPPLLRMFRSTDSPLLVHLIALAQKQHVVTVHYTPASIRRTRASFGLQMLGPKAAGAVPELLRIYDENPSEEMKAAVPFLLGVIGPEAKAAIPSLLKGAIQTNVVVRMYAISALGMIRAEPDFVVPTLIAALQDPCADVRERATWALASFGADAKAAVPALLYLHAYPEKDVVASEYRHPALHLSQRPVFSPLRSDVEWALKQIDPEVAAKLGAN